MLERQEGDCRGTSRCCWGFIADSKWFPRDRERRIGAFTQCIFISGERPFKRNWQYGSTNGFLEYEAQRPTKYSIKRMVSGKL